MRSRVYVDTSVFGGCEDVEFLDHSRSLVSAMAAGEYVMVISEVTLFELEKAPVPVRAHLERIPGAEKGTQLNGTKLRLKSLA